MPVDVTALILAGGLGTRLRSQVADRPKVLAEVAGRPFLHYLLHQLQLFSIGKVVLCTGYMAELVEEQIGFKHGNLEIKYSREHDLLGTGGAIRLAVEEAETEDILVLNGDSFCDFSFDAFLQFHQKHGARASVLLTKVEDCGRYGSVTIDNENRIQRFVEKGGGKGAGLINAGAYLLSKERILTIPSSKTLSLESEVFPQWISDGLYGFISPSLKFIDIGTPESYHLAQEIFERPLYD